MGPPATISTVVTPAASPNLVDIATVKMMLGLTDTSADAFLALLIPQASAAAANFTNNKFVVETILDQIFPGRDGRPWTLRTAIAPLQLSRWPLVSVGSVIETIAGTPTTLISGTDYLVDAVNGQLVRLDSFGFPRAWGSDPVAVTFTAGFAAIPFEVVAAVVEIVKIAYYAQGRDPMVRSQNAPGVFEQAFWFGNGPGVDNELPPSIAGKLLNYRMPVVA
ncbi:hypothetical protein DFR50_14260 [Roseiarcus fermentans]|uniref:PhiE125 gp8 family phage protein n=1 Tax=Roseiarcus fermentans TaxID=1473586 RepID=A0A366EN00_9HYPH|nr:phage head-tail connector protein [Roseiarcus fermentans]RBP03812.1 hypothetical protein DFR50_14260 [Roseiarcus fermentans]